MKINSIFIMLTVSIVSLTVTPAFAQVNPAMASITVTTDKSTYSDGDQMTISGTVSAQGNIPISIVIRDPSQNIVLLGQVSPSSDNTYSTIVTAGGSLWTASGTYEVDVTYGSKDNTAKTTFLFTGFMPVIPITIQGQTYNATYQITNGKVLGVIPNTDTKSLAIRIQPSGSGTISITLPRSLIDSKNNGQDSQFVVQDDGVSTTFNETRTDSNSRTLDIPFGTNNAQIIIIGTQIVPEFGTITMLVLAIAMASIILYFRTRLQHRVL
ncbi:MAG: PEFG-CTERM sorting domain-containing protein [Nitrosotalea sp.]